MRQLVQSALLGSIITRLVCLFAMFAKPELSVVTKAFIRGPEGQKVQGKHKRVKKCPSPIGLALVFLQSGI